LCVIVIALLRAHGPLLYLISARALKLDSTSRRESSQNRRPPSAHRPEDSKTTLIFGDILRGSDKAGLTENIQEILARKIIMTRRQECKKIKSCIFVKKDVN